MTNLSNIESIIISHFKQGRDYVVDSEKDGKTNKLVYTILTDDLRREISPFPQLINVSVEGLKMEEGNRRDGHFSYEQGGNGGSDKFTVITGQEASQREAEALRRPREIEKKMREIKQKHKQIAQQMQGARESGGPEIINTTSFTQRRRDNGQIIEETSRTNYSSPEQSGPSRIGEITGEESHQEQHPQQFRPPFPRKK